MKKTVIALVTLLITSFSLFAQYDYPTKDVINFFRGNQIRDDGLIKSLTSANIKGSPYLNEEFTNGTVYTTTKFKYEGIPLRYNIYNDNLEFKTPEGNILAIADPKSIELAEFGKHKMVYLPFVNVKKAQQGFFLVIQEGKASLYARPEVEFKEKEEPSAYRDGEPARFEERPDSYYVRVGDTEARKINNKKDLVEVFPDHQKEMAAFVKKNKIRANKPELLQKLVDYYNTL